MALAGDLGVEVRDVALEGREPVLHVRVPHEALVPGPVRDVVEHPRAHRRAVPVAARHADELRVLLVGVPA